MTTETVTTTTPENTVSDTAKLSSLNRNYRAYLNSKDPRMAAISAYAIAYAEFEAENGPDAVPTDPALSDEALREALESFTKDGVVTDDTLADAKDILGVGPAVGKIDEIRETLPKPEPTDPELEPDTTDPEAAEAVDTETVTVTELEATTSDTANLSSLNRNYHAYLNSKDPRMAAVSAYATAYAEFEAENGPDTVPTDPALSDEALREALESFTKDGVVTDDTLADAKDILGVGPAVGKIDEIRETLPKPEVTDPELEPEATDPELETVN
ncbi:hypothetical protein [Sinorhizobium terangae]|uniref:hypothetical protein n=1 Tax=Sinorhizobium terangae TaxID=110322 RepID=UPI0024B24999|nr:hypothetical protein [Sinorhizobium terangae]WFU51357.1 hypothetical protein QA637_22600 [Sinorhizobium terangae]